MSNINRREWEVKLGRLSDDLLMEMAREQNIDTSFMLTALAPRYALITAIIDAKGNKFVSFRDRIVTKHANTQME